MKLGKHQQGMTFIGWVMVFAIIAFFATLTVKLAPVYLEYFKVRSLLTSLQEVPMVTHKSKGEIWRLLQNRMEIDDIESMKRENFKIQSEKGRLQLSVSYEVRTHIMFNADVILTFHKEVEIIGN